MVDSIISSSNNLISSGSVTKKITLTDGLKINFIHVPKLNLYVISDVDNFGPHWINVEFEKNNYNLKHLLGSNPDTYLPVARFISKYIIESTFKEKPPVELSLARKQFTLNLSLRNFDRITLTQIMDQLFNPEM
ncbi:uncharacterized protein LOC128397131 [Panonychus citri]|uniref:uncharacterized protein LOC128397131 n=1 Tax=Panonychus citri TaxID=50023 RepID=UPI002307D738|nr:uncharacterized protein LOC128397131 [Panonychus citri]